MVSNSLALYQNQDGEGDVWSGSVLGVGVARSRAQTRCLPLPVTEPSTLSFSLPFLSPPTFPLFLLGRLPVKPMEAQEEQ